VADQEYALDRQQLQNELTLLQQGTAEYERAYNQIRELDARHQLDLTSIDRQASQERIRLQQQEVTEWRKAVGEVENAESTLVSDVLNRRRTLSQSMMQISAQFVTQEIQNDLRAMTTRVALANTEEAQKKAVEQGGLLYHLALNLTKTSSDKARAVTQTAAVVAAQHEQTAAVATGAAAQQASAAALGTQIVLSDAAKAYAGTFASVAQIPYVGWAMAPEAAAAAYASVAAMAPAASLDVGAWNVPHDMTAQIHAGESVVPKTFAEGMRENGGFGGGGDGDTVHNHTHNYAMSVSSMDSKDFARFIGSSRNRDAIIDMLREHLGNGR
jgi:hypothetical protein